MSSRVLRKLQGEKELPVEDINSDQESESPYSGGARRKQFNVNRYDLLNQLSHSESEVKEDDNETEAGQMGGATENDVHDTVTKRKKKKRKKKSGKMVGNHRRSSEDNVENGVCGIQLDEVERSVREVNRILGEPKNLPGPSSALENRDDANGLLNIHHKHLNPHYELKRIFGAQVVQAEQGKRRSRGRINFRSTWLVTPKDSWPGSCKAGISMTVNRVENGLTYFQFEHSPAYQQVQMSFLEAVDSLQAAPVFGILNTHLYHIDSLLQCSDIFKMSDDWQSASESVELALYYLESSMHPSFSFTRGTCRLEYKFQENRCFHIALLKHAGFLSGRACHRTALELCKLGMILDPSDPLGLLLFIDTVALRARQYTWLASAAAQWQSERNVHLLPNWAYSYALAKFYLSSKEGGNLTEADDLIQTALIRFPGVLCPLLEKCAVQTDKKVFSHHYFRSYADETCTPPLQQLISLYCSRARGPWQESSALAWLERNVVTATARVEAHDALVAASALERRRLYPKTPIAMLRHIVVLNVDDVPVSVEDPSQPLLTSDPFPPSDGINKYAPRKRERAHTPVGSPFAALLQSLLPTFNLSDNSPETPPPQINGDMEEGNEAAAVILPAGEEELRPGSELRMSVGVLVNAMREMLTMIHGPDGPHDADIDDGTGSDNDNYLT